MHVYLINMIMICLEDCITKVKNAGKSYRKLFCALASGQFILISGLRSITTGADTPVYKELFEYYQSISWGKMLQLFIEMFTRSGTYDSRDMAYYAFTKIFASIIPSFRLFLFFVIIIFMAGFTCFVYKYSSDCCMSYLIFASFMFAFYGLTGIRQTIATLLCVFVGFEYISKRKIFPFLAIILLASMFHKTSIILLPFYFLYNVKITNLYKMMVPVAFSVVYILKDRLVLIFTQGTYAKYADSTDSAPYNLFVLITLIVLASLVLYERMAARNNMVHIYVNATVLGMFILELSMTIPILVRLSHYYIIFIVLLIPELFMTINKRERTILSLLFSVLLCMLLIKTGVTYKFMWQ